MVSRRVVRRVTLGTAVFLVTAVLAVAHPGSAGLIQEAVITNGTVMLGVNPTGDLNIDCSGDPACPPPSMDEGVSILGLRYVPFNAESLSPGDPYEGWGAADAASGLSGFTVNGMQPPSSALSPDTFTATGSTALSTVTISSLTLPGHALKVTHDFHPAQGTPNLFEIDVTVANTGTQALNDVRYRRVMDWDIEPTAFQEWVTIQGATKATFVRFDSDEGFSDTNPLSPNEYDESEVVCGVGYTGPCDFTDLGQDGVYPAVTTSDDHGAMFDLGLGALAPGSTVSFRMFYGAAEGTAVAMDAVGLTGIEVLSLGEPDCPADPQTPPRASHRQYRAVHAAQPICTSVPPNAGVEQGLPVSFVFGLADVGGLPLRCPEAPTFDGTHVVGTGTADTLTGTEGPDVICGLGGGDTLRGLGDKDRLFGGTGGDTVRAGPGKDRAFGGPGSDVLRGQGGSDRLRGQQRADRLSGGAKDDRLSGGPGSDRCRGGPGDDQLSSCEE